MAHYSFLGASPDRAREDSLRGWGEEGCIKIIRLSYISWIMKLVIRKDIGDFTKWWIIVIEKLGLIVILINNDVISSSLLQGNSLD